MTTFGRILVRGVFASALCLSLLHLARPVRAVSTTLVINEIDYDQPGIDTAEFLELKNVSSSAINLSGYTVELVNGTGGGAALYQTIVLPNVDLAAGDYFVICASNVIIDLNCDSTAISAIQNGSPDAVGLRQGGALVDAVSYAGPTSTGAPYTEGSSAGTDIPAVGPAQGISRCPDGTDTDQNNVDLILRPSTPGATNDCPSGDVPPTVTTTSPTGGATNVATNANITINFSEAVTVTGNWFSIQCVMSGFHVATVSGGPQSFTLDPTADFAFSENCTVRIRAAAVADQDVPIQNMTADFVFSFQTAAQPIGACGDPATRIHVVQGSGLSSPLNLTQGVVIEGIVVGDYQGGGQFGGFHMQEEDADADSDPGTSEGIFVFTGTGTSFPVSRGDKVRVQGRVFEFSSSGTLLTEISPVTAVLVCSSINSVTATPVTLPVDSLDDWEAFEGMLIEIEPDLTVTENFTLGRFGEVALSVNGRLLNPTAVTTPGAAANALQDLNNRSRILLDDGDNTQNLDPTVYPAPGLSALNTLRSGDVVHGLTGVLEQRFGVYRVQPIGPIAFDHENERPEAPTAVGGRLRVAAMNVLNYFTTLDVTNTPPFPCGPAGGLECRGANSAAEFTRQRDKIISAILGLDADIVGLMEVENNATAAIQNLVDGLNAQAGPATYAFVNAGTIGTDAIKVGLIYKPARVTPVGAHAILNSSVDPNFIDTLNRPVLAQTLEENATGGRFTLAVAHLKSKGSDCNDIGDPDTGDGQGNCNVTRTLAATALVNWLAGDPTGSGDPDYLIIGDLNSYAFEDPVTAIKNAGYVNLIQTFLGPEAYSFVFQGQSGYLDHALANNSLAHQVTGATEWHVNADEPIALDYNLEFKSPNHQTTLYDSGPYRSSDHDPLIVGLNLTTLKVTSPSQVWLGLKNSDDQGTRFDVSVLLSVNGSPVTEGLTRCVTGITRNPSNAKEVLVSLGAGAPIALDSGDVISQEVRTRIGTNADDSKCSGHSNAVGLRLYYDSANRPSQFGAEITPDPLTAQFLHSSGASFIFNTTPPTATTPKQKDSGPVAFAGGNPWKSVGTWSRSVP